MKTNFCLRGTTDGRRIVFVTSLKNILYNPINQLDQTNVYFCHLQLRIIPFIKTNLAYSSLRTGMSKPPTGS